MNAAVWHDRRDVRIEDVQSPPLPGNGQVQVKVSWCGICGTDLHEYLDGPIYIPVGRPHPLTGVQAPVIIGHEMQAKWWKWATMWRISVGEIAWPRVPSSAAEFAAGVAPARWRSATVWRS